MPRVTGPGLGGTAAGAVGHRDRWGYADCGHAGAPRNGTTMGERSPGTLPALPVAVKDPDSTSLSSFIKLLHSRRDGDGARPGATCTWSPRHPTERRPSSYADMRFARLGGPAARAATDARHPLPHRRRGVGVRPSHRGTGWWNSPATSRSRREAAGPRDGAVCRVHGRRWAVFRAAPRTGRQRSKPRVSRCRPPTMRWSTRALRVRPAHTSKRSQREEAAATARESHPARVAVVRPRHRELDHRPGDRGGRPGTRCRWCPV